MGKNERYSWVGLAFIWTGAMISVSGLMLGGQLVDGGGFLESLLVATLGYGIVVAIMTLQGIQSLELRRVTVGAAARSFGEKGAQQLIAFLLAFACLGWFGVQGNLAGSAFSSFLQLYGIEVPVWLSTLIWCLIMLFSAVYGVRVLEILNYIAVPVLLAACSWAVYQSLQVYSWSEVLAFRGTGSLSFNQQLSVTIGSFALGAVIAGDYAAYAKSRRDVFLAALFGTLPAGVFVIGIGAFLTIAAGTADIGEVFLKLGSPILSITALMLATWTTNAVNAYSGGVAFVHMFDISKEKERMATIGAGLIGTVLATIGIIDYFIPLMSVMSAMIPPVASVMIAAYWFGGKKDLTEAEEVTGYDWLGVTSWLIGATVAALPTLLDLLGLPAVLPDHPLIGIGLSFVVYLIGNWWTSRRQLSAES